MRYREEIPSILEEEGLRTGAELGVQLGGFAAHTLTVWKSCQRYYLIDIWGKQVGLLRKAAAAGVSGGICSTVNIFAGRRCVRHSCCCCIVAETATAATRAATRAAPCGPL